MSNLYVKIQTKKSIEQCTTNNTYKLEAKIKEIFLEKIGQESYEESKYYLIVNGDCLVIKDKE